MRRPLHDLATELEQITAADEQRRTDATQARAEATRLGSRLPLVHRIPEWRDVASRPAAPSPKPLWAHCLSRRRLFASATQTPFERDVGRDKSVYFFVGSGAYHRGSVAVLLQQTALDPGGSTFTPFDTGALGAGYIHPKGRPTIDSTEKMRIFRQHLGEGADLPAFMGSFIAAHFSVPSDYVKSPQVSEPLYSAYHGLVSPTKDRRAWTVEACAHADVDLSRPGAQPVSIVAAYPAYRRDLASFGYPVRFAAAAGPTAFYDTLVDEALRLSQ